MDFYDKNKYFTCYGEWEWEWEWEREDESVLQKERTKKNSAYQRTRHPQS